MSDENATGIDFYMHNVMNINEATRQNRLAEILDSYAGNKETDSVYIIQNSKRKEAAGVISSVRYHQSREKTIRSLENEVLRLSDEILRLKAMVRNDHPVYSMAQALERLDLDEDDIKDIFDNSDEVNID